MGGSQIIGCECCLGHNNAVFSTTKFKMSINFEHTVTRYSHRAKTKNKLKIDTAIYSDFSSILYRSLVSHTHTHTCQPHTHLSHAISVTANTKIVFINALMPLIINKFYMYICYSLNFKLLLWDIYSRIMGKVSQFHYVGKVSK